MYKLLIVEDEHLIRKWLNTALDYCEYGFEVIGLAQNGEDGAEMIFNCRPDVVFSDISMPKKDAFAMFEATKEISYEKVLISGYSDFENAKKGIAYGVVDFIAKPIDIQEVKALLVKLKQKFDSKVAEPKKVEHPIIAKLSLENIEYLSEATNKVVEWIHLHFSENETIADLARDLGYSESHLYNIFKEETAMTINQYKRQYRIKKAASMIVVDPEIKIYELADSVGFNDHHYFNQTFKKVTGYSVNDFKETLK